MVNSSPPLPLLAPGMHTHHGSLARSLEKSLDSKPVVLFTPVKRSLIFQYSSVIFMSLTLSTYHLCDSYLLPKSAPFLVNLNFNSRKELYSKRCHSNDSRHQPMPYNSVQFYHQQPRVSVRLSPARLPSPQMPSHKSQVPGLHALLSKLGTNSGVPTIPPHPHHKFCNSLQQLTELQKKL